mgnify:CR=1 FL=1
MKSLASAVALTLLVGLTLPLSAQRDVLPTFDQLLALLR